MRKSFKIPNIALLCPAQTPKVTGSVVIQVEFIQKQHVQNEYSWKILRFQKTPSQKVSIVNN